jgi:lipopolysaccharide heptosyltransferase II
MTVGIVSEAADPAPRVLVVLLGAIGDVVRALPLLGRIRRGWPRAYLAWAVEPKSEPILREHRWLDDLIVYDRKRAPWSFIQFLRKIRSRKFDLVLDLQRHLKSGVISFASAAPERIGFAGVNSKEFNYLFSTRQIEPQPHMRLKLMQYQAFADAIGVPAAPIDFGLRLSAEEETQARKVIAHVPQPMMGVILGSSWPSRLYFPAPIAEVIRELAHSVEGSVAPFPVLIGGEDDRDLADEVMRELDGLAAMNLTGRTRLRDLIAIFTECSVAFGPDSGPMHIAAAVGCPVVSLWGATAPERSAPWGFGDLAIHGDIPCHPCYLRKCPIGRECMRRIAPATVAAAVRKALAMRSQSDQSRQDDVASGMRRTAKD